MAAKRILLIAYHFPPLAGSSGIQRTLRFVQHLPAFGWQPIVLTAHPRAYERTSDDLGGDVPADVPVCRAQAWDTSRHFAVRGRYFGALARPDRWTSWRFDGVRQGLRLVREHRPSVIWSTYPIATAHVIGAELQRRTGLPWVADFRDPMYRTDYPPSKVLASLKALEDRVFAQCTAATFTTPSAGEDYRRRYPAAADRVLLLENGYDEGSFAAVEHAAADAGPLNPGAVTILHSGIVYPRIRDPRPLLQALRRLHDAGDPQVHRLRIRFRAAEHEDLLREEARKAGVQHLIEVLPPVAYREALSEMLRADALLLMQGAISNHQIPAKLYEYLRARRPILCLADPASDTAAALRAVGVDAIAALEDAGGIADLLHRFLRPADRPLATLAASVHVDAASRLGRTQQLAGWLDQVHASAPGASCLASSQRRTRSGPFAVM